MSSIRHRGFNRIARHQPKQIRHVDWSNPTSASLAYLGNMAVGTYDATGCNLAAQRPTIAGAASFASGPFGGSLQLTGAATDTVSFPTSLITPATSTYVPAFGVSNGTIEILFSMTSAGSRAHLFGIADTNPNSGGLHRAFISFNGSAPGNIYAWDSGGGDIDSSVLYRADGLPQHLFFTFGKSAGEASSSQKIYRDGALIKSATVTLSNLGVSTFLYFGNRLNTGTTTFAAHIYKAAVYAEKLTPDQVQALTEEPWQQLQQFGRKTYFLPTAAAAGNPWHYYASQRRAA